MRGKRQFSWQPTLIEDWATEPADEARPLPVDNNEDNFETNTENDPKGFQDDAFKLRKQAVLLHQAAIDFNVSLNFMAYKRVLVWNFRKKTQYQMKYFRQHNL